MSDYQKNSAIALSRGAWFSTQNAPETVCWWALHGPAVASHSPPSDLLAVFGTLLGTEKRHKTKGKKTGIKWKGRKKNKTLFTTCSPDHLFSKQVWTTLQLPVRAHDCRRVQTTSASEMCLHHTPSTQNTYNYSALFSISQCTTRAHHGDEIPERDVTYYLTCLLIYHGTTTHL